MKEITAKTLPRVARAGVRLGRFWFKHNIDPILAAVLSVGVKKLVQKGARHLPRSVQPLFGVRQSRTPLLLCALGGGVAAAAVGGAAALSLLGSDTPPLERSLEGDRRFFSWRGHRIAYYVAGQGEPLLLVHSINAAASAHEMRLPFALLQRDFQVFAIDLIGFGASDRPALNYDADLYVALLTDFLRDVVPGPSHVCASSLSAAFAATVAAQQPELVRSLLLIEPTGVVTLAGPQGPGGKLVEGILRTPLFGAAFFNLLVSRPSLRYYLEKATGDKGKVDAAMVEQSYRTSHQPGARYAPAAFVGRGMNIDLSRVLPALPERTMVVWTPRSEYQDTGAERDAFVRLNPRLRMLTIPGSGGLIQDEQPERFAELVRDLAGRDPQAHASVPPPPPPEALR